MKYESGLRMPERILDVTALTARFQTTVPKTVREVLNITTEDRIIWVLDENGEIKVRNTNVGGAR